MSIRDYLAAVCRGAALPSTIRFADQLDAQDAHGLPTLLRGSALPCGLGSGPMPIVWPEHVQRVMARWARMYDVHLRRVSRQRHREQTGLILLSP